MHSKVISFSSRPGDLESKDDFYTLDNKFVVIETSLNSYNPSLYDSIKPQSIPAWLRVNLANKAAKNVSHWS